MSFLLDELLEGPCVDEPHRLQSALPDFHKTAVLLTLTDLTDLVSEERWSRGRAPDCQSRDGGSIPPTAVSKLRQFRSPHICLSFGIDTKSRRSVLSGVYARGSKRSHTWVNV